MKPIYAIHPGPDGITAERLARLYGLKPTEWCTWDDDRPETVRGKRYDAYVHLGARFNGDYTLPKTIWNGHKHVLMPENVVAFLAEYRALCLKHGLALNHEDGHGNFIIERASEDLIEWAEGADLGNVE